MKTSPIRDANVVVVRDEERLERRRASAQALTVVSLSAPVTDAVDGAHRIAQALSV
jgi:hypothetical protein